MASIRSHIKAPLGISHIKGVVAVAEVEVVTKALILISVKRVLTATSRTTSHLTVIHPVAYVSHMSIRLTSVPKELSKLLLVGGVETPEVEVEVGMVISLRPKLTWQSSRPRRKW